MGVCQLKMRLINSTIVVICLWFTIGVSQTYVWELKQAGVTLGGPVIAATYNTDIVYYGSDDIIYKSIDRGETFIQTGIVVPNSPSDIKNIILDNGNPGTFLVATRSSPDEIYKTTDDGQNWLPSLENADFAYFGIPMEQDPSHPDTIYTISDDQFMRSTNFGDSWDTLTTVVGISGGVCDIAVFPDTSIILMGDDGTGIWRSTDSGASWTQVVSSTVSPTPGEIPTIAVDYMNPGVAWAVKWGDGGGVFKSTDYGLTWTEITNSDFVGENMWTVHVQVDDSNVLMVGCFSCLFVWRSLDGGTTWTKIDIIGRSYQLFVDDSTTQYAAQEGGFFKLTRDPPFPVELTSFSASVEDEQVILYWETANELNNYGFYIERSFQSETWVNMGFVEGNGNSNSPKYYTYKDNSVSLAGTYSYRLKQIDNDGTFEYSFVTIVDIATPVDYELKQNYPNPFNPSTIIKFYIPVSSNVKLKLFNMLGQEVAELIDAEITPGIHKVEFNAVNLSSGTYFYFLEANGDNGNQFSDMKKMVLLK